MAIAKTVNSVECGLVRVCPASDHCSEPTKFPIPLQSVEVEASVVHAVAQVQITQVFVNNEEEPMEAIYYFPVDPSGAVTHFEAELEGRKIKAVVKPEEEAKEVYEKAVEQKQTAFLGEENTADIFKVRVGYLKPGSSAKITIGYVTEVKNERDSNAIRFYIPTTVAPRYVPMETTDDKAQDLGNMQFSDTSPAPMTIKTHVSIQGDIKSIESPTHKVVVSSQGPVEGKTGWTKATVELNGTTTDMDRDFVLLITPVEPHQPRVYVEKLDKSLAVMAHLIPSFKLKEQKTELIFVLDRSGSMQGASIKLATEALSLFLHSVPADCYFNIVGFGSNYELLFPQSVKYDDNSLKIAKQHANDLTADMGGTEVLAPLKHIYATKAVAGYWRQIFVITDGEVGNEDEVIGFTKAKSHQSRVFALGIGSAASHHLVDGIAVAGGGNSAFVSYNESVAEKVLQQLKDALQPSLTNVSVKWHGVKGEVTKQQPSPSVVTEKTLLGYGKPLEAAQDNVSTSVPTQKSYWQAPEKIPPIFDGSQLLVFGIFENLEANLPTGCTLTANSPDGPLSVDIQLSEENDVGATGMLHKLAAIKIVRELELKLAALESEHRHCGRRVPGNSEETQFLKEKITELAVREGIASKFTSFVAVDTYSSSEDCESSESRVMQTRMVPSQLAHGWGASTVTVSASVPSSPILLAHQQQPSPIAVASVVNPLMQCSKSHKKKKKNKGTILSLHEFNQLVDGTSRASPGQSVIYVPRKQFPSWADETESDDSYMYTCRVEKIVLPSEPRPCRSFDADRHYCRRQNAISDNDKLKYIVEHQTSSGYFRLEESLLEALEVDARNGMEAIKVSEKNRWDLDAWATALALTFLEVKLMNLKGSWELVAKKAKDWLSKNHGSVQEAMMAAAASLIKSA